MQAAVKNSLRMTCLLLSTLVIVASASHGHETHLKREMLIEDVRQLGDILESTHPDPYTHGGGRIAFHRRLHELLNAIPKDGMSIEQSKKQEET